jgi:uncharacterized cupin superfamily protein
LVEVALPKLDLDTIPQTNSTGYPGALAEAVAGRWVRRLAPVSGISDFGFSHVVLKPGAASSHRHWHEDEDEFVVMLSGEAVLIDDAGETVMGPGDIAAFPKNDGNGHQLVNRSDADCTFIAVGKPPVGDCHYSDVDLFYSAATGFTRRGGSAY